MGLVVFVTISALIYWAKVSPESFFPDSAAYVWTLGPPPRTLAQAATRHSEHGLDALNDRYTPAKQRVESYRASLLTADQLLRRSLRADPSQAKVLAHLAAVNWELDPPLTEETRARYSTTIGVASRMAPRVPTVQAQLGELLLKMGRPDEALAYFNRTIELEPTSTRRIVEILRAHLFSATEIMNSIRPHAEVLAEVQGPAFEDGEEREYLHALEREFDRARSVVDPRLLARYGNTCMRIGDADRLKRRMTAFGSLPAPDAEAKRRVQLSRAWSALGDSERAVDNARLALEFLPEDPGLTEHLGDMLNRSGDHAGAIVAFRTAIGEVARSSSDATERARLYRKIGQAQESQRSIREAYESYRFALTLDPDERHARARVEAMEESAGLRPPR